MEQGNNRHPKNVCEKVYKAVTVCPAFRAIRRISYRPQEPRPASPVPNSSTPTPLRRTVDIQSKTDPQKDRRSVKDRRRQNTPESREAPELVPVNFDYSSQPPPKDKPKSAAPVLPIKNGLNKPEATPTNSSTVQSPGQITKAGGKVESPVLNSQERTKSGAHIEDTFTDYIARAKKKIRTMSHVREEKPVPRKDRFTEYIDRTKIKFRTMSSIGGGRSNSFK